MTAKSPTVMGSVATPRRPISTEIYRGEDLRRTSPRAGAYDAFSLPSVMSGRLVTREQQREELLAPLPPAPLVPTARSAASTADPLAAALAPPPEAPEPQPEPVQAPARFTYIQLSGAANPIAPGNEGRRFYAIESPVKPLTKGRSGSLNAYRPREGSGPHRVLQHLQAHGGHLLYTEIRDQFGIPQHSLTAIFKPALVRGALIRVQVGDRRALALPGYVPPPPAAPPAPAAAPQSEAGTPGQVAAIARTLTTATEALLYATEQLKQANASFHALAALQRVA